MALFDQISSRNSERGGEAFLPKSQKIPKWSKINAQEWVRLTAFAFPPPPVIERDDRGGGGELGDYGGEANALEEK